MTEALARPPYDSELEAVLESLKDVVPKTITSDLIPLLRSASPVRTSLENVIGDRPVIHQSVTVPGHLGDQIEISIFRRSDHRGTGPGLYFVHGGGMILGDQLTDVGQIVDWVVAFDAVAVSVGYRLAPEFPDPYPVEDAYAALVWVADQAEELGIDPQRLVIVGASAGGGIAAGTALLARDRQGPALLGQMLLYPMLDDRDASVSTRQFEGLGIWDRGSNVTGWNALLGERRGGKDVSVYAAPARVDNHAGLPSTYLECGSAEVFRDEDVAYASSLWTAGVQAELHVWAGGFHTFDTIAPQAALTARALDARRNWLARLLSTELR